METQAGHKGKEIIWSLGSCKSKPGGYNNHSTTVESCCGLRSSSIALTCEDSSQNNWEGGHIRINEKKYCDDKSWVDSQVTPHQIVDLAGKLYAFLFCEII